MIIIIIIIYIPLSPLKAYDPVLSLLRLGDFFIKLSRLFPPFCLLFLNILPPFDEFEEFEKFEKFWEFCNGDILFEFPLFPAKLEEV